MGILPIGFFSPLPLAMMIPFMATQSLAMGEAFGKSFQYGKRKISSLSNEEFNKLTFHDLMVEQTANIAAIVPELNKQMAQSKTMQAAIFKEMVDLIPTFFDSLFSALDPKHIEDPTLTSQASPSPAITEIRLHGTGNQFEESQQLKELKALLEKSLEQQGTKESLAEKLRLENLPPPPPPSIPTPPDAAALARGKSLSEDEEWRAWSTKLSKLKQEFQRQGTIYRGLTRPKTQIEKSRRATAWNAMFSVQKEIRQMSNDYRHPNNNIRENALRLRQAIASGQWQR